MVVRIVISFLIFLIVFVPAIVVSVPVVAILLLTNWDGTTTPFGNAKWGRANNHFDFPTKGYWQEFNWLVLRNPVNNLATQYLSVRKGLYNIRGAFKIGDKIAGGFYEIRSQRAWEYYLIKPYTVFGQRRCIRARIGWKLDGTRIGDPAAYVFAINPWKKYSGV